MSDIRKYTGSNATEMHDEIIASLWINRKEVVEIVDGRKFEESVITIKMEHPVNSFDRKRGGYPPIGYIDMVFLGDRDCPLFMLEVKSYIKSITETVRQINKHKEFLPSGVPYYVASPDDRFKEILESQGIGFLDTRRFLS